MIFRRFFQIAYFSYKSLFGWLMLRVYVLTKIINPVFQLVFYSLLAGYANQTRDVTPFVIGNALLLCYRNALFGVGNNLVTERYFGTLKLNILSSTSTFFFFLSYGFMHIVDGFFNILIGLGAGVLIFDLNLIDINLGLFFTIVLVTVFATIGLGLLIGCLGLIFTDMNLIMNLIAMSLLICSGANFPISKFPDFIQQICYLFPLTRGIEASRAVFAGANFEQVQGLIFSEAVLGIILILVSVIALRGIENLARKKATLELF